MSDVILNIHVKAQKEKNEVVEIRPEFVRIKVSAPPKRGEANKELLRFLSELLEIPKDWVEIISGFNQPRKIVRVWGIEREKLFKRLKENIKK